MEHSHHHHNHSGAQTGKKIIWTIILNISITLFQIAGGLISNSLSILTDALHNLGDSLSLVIAFIAHTYSFKDPSSQKTFGYKRLQIIAAFLNSLLLFGFAAIIIKESIIRLIYPESINEVYVFFIALAGFLFNLFSILILFSEKKRNLNLRAAYLHLIGDMATSVTVMIGAVFIYFFQIVYIDSILSILIGIYIIYSSVSIFLESLQILLQFVPRNIDAKEVQKKLESFPEIENIHHIHIWQLDDHTISMECHVDLKQNLSVEETHPIKNKIKEAVKKEFHINHSTFQFEFNSCSNKDLIYREQKN